MPLARRPANHSSNPGHCHKLVKSVAQEMAGEWYEDAAQHDNKFYADWPSDREFVRMNWGLFVKPAREQLARMLGMNYPEQMKAEIYEALVADHTLH